MYVLMFLCLCHRRYGFIGLHIIFYFLHNHDVVDDGVIRPLISKKLLHATTSDIFEYRVNSLQDVLQTLGVVTLLSHISGFYRGQHSRGQKASSRQRLSRPLDLGRLPEQELRVPAIPSGPRRFR